MTPRERAESVWYRTAGLASRNQKDLAIAIIEAEIRSAQYESLARGRQAGAGRRRAGRNRTTTARDSRAHDPADWTRAIDRWTSMAYRAIRPKAFTRALGEEPACRLGFSVSTRRAKIRRPFGDPAASIRASQPLDWPPQLPDHPEPVPAYLAERCSRNTTDSDGPELSTTARNIRQ
jgi:hypothetical protein